MSATPASARPAYQRLRTGLAVLGAAALLVAGVDAAGYAATGDSLLLGRTNKTSKVTTVQNTAKGPALTLRTRSSAPPLTVTSSRLVQRLNADQVDGLSAEQLSPTIRQGVLVPAGATIVGGRYRSFGLAAGPYRISMFGTLTGAAGESWSCVIADLVKVQAGDKSGYLLADFGDGSGSVSATSTVTVPAGRTWIGGCEGQPGMSGELPLTVSLEPLRTLTTLPTRVFAPKRAARAALRRSPVG